MTGNGKHIYHQPKKGFLTGGWLSLWHCFTHIRGLLWHWFYLHLGWWRMTHDCHGYWDGKNWVCHMPKNFRCQKKIWPRFTKELKSEEREGWSYVLVESPLQVPLSRWLHSSPARRVSLGCHCCKTHAPAMTVPRPPLLEQVWYKLSYHFRTIWIPICGKSLGGFIGLTTLDLTRNSPQIPGVALLNRLWERFGTNKLPS